MTVAAEIELDGKHLQLEQIRSIAQDGALVRVADSARKRVAAARAFVDRQFNSGEAIYGVTTGFGRLANVSVAPSDAAALQLNLVRSHAAGTGPPLAEKFVRAAGVLRVSSLSAGHSGIRTQTLDLLVALLNERITPLVPAQGSVGASGDLARIFTAVAVAVNLHDQLFAGSGAQRARLPPVELLAPDVEKLTERKAALDRHLIVNQAVAAMRV
ncbi:MAG: hypothetical protein NVS9B12_14540 [Vulcanimicrobiaceae bacterium]